MNSRKDQRAALISAYRANCCEVIERLANEARRADHLDDEIDCESARSDLLDAIQLLGSMVGAVTHLASLAKEDARRIESSGLSLANLDYADHRGVRAK